MKPADIAAAVFFAALLAAVKPAPKVVDQVFPTPLGSRRGTRVFGATDAAIIERLVRL